MKFVKSKLVSRLRLETGCSRMLSPAVVEAGAWRVIAFPGKSLATSLVLAGALDYSNRSALTGCILAARSAGKTLAITAMATAPIITQISVNGSMMVGISVK